LERAPNIKTFPPFRLDPGNQCLWRGDVRISLVPKAFAVLQYLVGHAGRLVTQQELLQALWRDTHVEPEVLRRYILEIRRALEDPPKKPLFIETLPKRGYRFIAAIREESAALTQASQPTIVPGRLVGREAALAELDTYWSAARQGERQVVFVTGEAGIGKTSLVDAFQQKWAQDSRIRIARGQCVEGFGGKEAYYPVLQALGRLIRGPDGEPVAQALAAQAPTWFIQFPSIVAPEQRATLSRELLGATRERMVREICEVLDVLTAYRPLILILEDLQWVDNPTLDLISAVTRQRGAAKLMLMATYRPVEVILSRNPLKLLKQELLVHLLCHEISLVRLSEADVEQYLAAEFPESNFAADLSGMIHRHSDGNPLFMVAILDRLRQRGLIIRDNGRWKLTVSAAQLDPGIPETLQQMLEVQLEQLRAPDLRLLRAASVAGRRFSSWAVGALLAADVDQVEDACERLGARQQFIRRAATREPVQGSASAQYEFKHVLYREVLYRQLPPTQRRQFHLRLAERMEALSTPPDPSLASELASHFEEACDYARAIRYLILTASNAARRYAHGDAIHLLRHGLDLLPQLPAETAREVEIQILDRISDALYAQGEMVQSAEVDYRVAEVAAQGGFKVAQARALTRVARALAFLDPARCITVCQRAVEVTKSHDDPLLQARTEMLAACWRIVTNGWRKEDADTCAAARDTIRRLSDQLPAYHEILYAHVQCTQGDYQEALQTAWSGIPKSVENGNLVVYLSAHSSLAQAFLHLGRWGDLLQVIATARDIAGKNHNAPWLGIFQATLAWLHFHSCDFQGARRLAEELLKTHTEEPAGQVRTMAMITAAFCDLELGAADQAVSSLTRVCERETNPRFFLDWYWRTIAGLGLSNAWIRKSEWDKAGSEAERFLQAALSTADPALKALAWDAKARVAASEPKRSREFIERAVKALHEFEVPLAAWRVYATASDLFRRAGDRQKAEQHRARAKAVLLALAQSFPEGEPLRESLLAAPMVQGILGKNSSKKGN